MKRWLPAALAVCCMIVSGNFLPAKALMVRMPSTPEKVAAASTIVIGKVVSFEDKLVEIAPSAGAPKVGYKIASIKIDDSIVGAKGLTHVRVGFIPLPPMKPVDPTTPQPAIRPIRPIGPRGGYNTQLEVGQEGCFFLARHGEGDFFIVPAMSQHIDKKQGDFDKQVAQVRQTVSVLADPIKALKAKDASDRFFAAAVVMQRFNAPPANPAKAKRGPADAEESKLILTALLDADWSKTEDYMMSPLGVFQRLGLQPKDGFQYPRPVAGQDFNMVLQQAAKAWLKENAGKYRIQRWVVE